MRRHTPRTCSSRMTLRNNSCDSHDTHNDYGANARDNSLLGHATLQCVPGKYGFFHQKRIHGGRLRSFVMCRGRRGILVA